MNRNISSSDLFRRTTRNFWQKWALAFKILPVILLVATLKLVAHHLQLEVMELNALFTSLVAGTIFLIGFLLSGVMADYKESEKLPSELAASLRTMYDDAYTLSQARPSAATAHLMSLQQQLLSHLMAWFYRNEKTVNMLAMLSQMNDVFVALERDGVQPAYVIRLKNEQHNFRKMLLRIDTIRDTNFIQSAYAILEAMGLIIAVGLIIINIKPFYASMFFTLVVTFLISYMFFLIRDLDNPFDYGQKGEGGTEVSLKPLHDLEHYFATLIPAS
ncbi:hypothetical protein LX69_01233 [Breznakibacter xylanolyticus]|uniref:DUF4239 domain-containing protein n=1 Tax=Breznakibacter xylanolyticus TaxID=990 RepID=A0A2W7NFD4_9BACT|nr:hypothetical protein [Breznakibacter xylanolyticus]PZX18193.1 hypothetical protein LX69_01233 [Breznakibacter xylanolyticus]